MLTDANPPAVLKLGDPRLRRPCEPVVDVAVAEFREHAAQLIEALTAFRAQHGFGRAMAAPQLGFSERFLAADLGEGPQILVDPEITWLGGQTFTLWDDCMSFPSLLVRVRRQRSISVAFLDMDGVRRSLERLGPARSELLQHEIDHLDGVLAVDRALDRESLVLREAFDADPDYFSRQVDYTIGAGLR